MKRKLCICVNNSILLEKSSDDLDYKIPTYECEESELYSLFKDDSDLILSQKMKSIEFGGYIYYFVVPFDHKRLNYFYYNSEMSTHNRNYKLFDIMGLMQHTELLSELLLVRSITTKSTPLSESISLLAYYDIKPILISELLTQETIIFNDIQDKQKAIKILGTIDKYYYTIDDWPRVRQQYVDEFYQHDPYIAPKIYKI